MKNRFSIRLLLACLIGSIILLGGCKLALPEQGDTTNKANDSFIGFYITLDSLQSFDVVAGVGGIQVVDSNGKVFAEKGADDTYSFPGIEGMAMFCPRISGPDDDNAYHTTVCDDGVGSVQIAINENGLTDITGTIQIRPKSQLAFFPNHVYQTSEGAVYLIPSTGTGMDGVIDSSLTLKAEEKVSLTVNGETSEQKSQATLTITVINEAVDYTIKQFSRDDRVLGMTSITKSKTPEFLHAHPEMAYAILETKIVNSSGKTEVLRDMVDWSDATRTFWFFDERGIAMGETVKLVSHS